MSGDNVASSSTGTERLDVASAAPESKISRLSRDSELSTSTDTTQRRAEVVETKRPSVFKEAVSTSDSETSSGKSRPRLPTSEVHSRSVGIISQSSLPERMSVNSGEDKDLSATVSLFLVYYFVMGVP